MKRYALLAATAVVGAGVAFQGSVNLQATTPGTPQNGHLNITGTARAGVMVGYSNTPTGIAYGGDFRSVSTSGRGVLGNASSPTGVTYGGLFQSFSTTGRGVAGIAVATSGFTVGGFFTTNSATGKGVQGSSNATSGLNYGVYGRNLSPDGYALFGEGNVSATGIFSGNGSGLTSLTASNISFGTLNDARLSSNVAKLAGSQQFTGQKIFTGGFVTDAFQFTVGATSGYVLKGDSFGVGTWQRDEFTMPVSDSVAGTGTGLSLTHAGTGDLSIFTINNPASVAEAVQGASNGGGDVFQASMTGTGRAGYFAITNNSNSNPALFALTNAASGEAVRGENTSTGFLGSGVKGESSAVAGHGVIGIGAVLAARGVTGVSGGYGVYSEGDFAASGTKAFRIDHPHDPTGKFLSHYCSESPMPQNFYSGNVVTGANGYAWIDLPDYFADINTNIKYQLTVIDESDDFVMAKVTKEVQNNRFQIRSSKARVKVSWRVEADRNDLRVRHRKPMDVEEKNAFERGTYQRPELYGLPIEMGFAYLREHANSKRVSPKPTR